MTLNPPTSSPLIDCVPLEFVDDKLTLKHLEEYLICLVSELENELSTLPDTTAQLVSISSPTKANTTSLLVARSNQSNANLISSATTNNGDTTDKVSTSLSSAYACFTSPLASPCEEDSNDDSINCSLSSLTKCTQPESPVSFITSTNYSPASFYEHNDDINYNLLTASQLQKLVSIK